VTAFDPDALVAWCASQRWYAANDQTVRSAAVVASEPIPGGAGLHWLLLAVGFEAGASATYQLVVDQGGGPDAVDRPEVLRWMFPHLNVDKVVLLGGEQSNTSLVIDGSVIVKVFRRVGPPGERNPDVEVVQALWDHGFRSVAEPLGDFTREDRDLGVARRFLPGAASGWDMALEDPWFMDEVGDLGRVTAQLHVAMAEAFGAAPGDAAAWAAAMHAQLARVPLPDGLDAAARYDTFATSPDPGSAIRIHGDYHLGQVLHRGGHWYLLDFEGEPARPVAERVAPSSPLRDVAGMLRSFGYAAAVGELPPVWEREARQRYLAGYLSNDAVAPLLPADIVPVLTAFELDKAVYEVGYERASRPDWEHVPMAAVRRLLD
jgi:maltokinase